jgi:hypothetical protein
MGARVLVLPFFAAPELSPKSPPSCRRTDLDAYHLQSRGGKGVINMKANSKIGKVVSVIRL